MAPDGRFDVAYTYAWSGTDNDVRLNRYAADGTLLGVNWVAASGINEQAPSVAMDNYGNAVVAYQKGNVGAWDIKAVRVSSTGTQGGEIDIASTSDDELQPSVALNRTDGAFAVAYTVLTSSGGVYVDVAEVSPWDRVTDTYNCGAQRYSSSISIDGNGYYMVSYTSFESSGDWNIRGRFGYLS
jgi:hypothetical protein